MSDIFETQLCSVPDCEFAKGLCAGVSTTAGCSDESQGADNCLSVPVLQS